MLRNVSQDLAQAIADDLGMPLPAAMPPVLSRSPAQEVDESRALSLFALPGTVGVQARRVAIWIGDGVDAKQANTIFGS